MLHMHSDDSLSRISPVFDHRFQGCRSRLKKAENSLIQVLDICRMSDRESVNVAVKPSREGCPLPYASVRLTVVLDLLVHIFTTELAEIALCPHAKKFPQVGNFDIALFKYKSLSLQLRYAY